MLSLYNRIYILKCYLLNVIQCKFNVIMGVVNVLGCYKFDTAQRHINAQVSGTDKLYSVSVCDVYKICSYCYSEFLLFFNLQNKNNETVRHIRIDISGFHSFIFKLHELVWSYYYTMKKFHIVQKRKNRLLNS